MFPCQTSHNSRNHKTQNIESRATAERQARRTQLAALNKRNKQAAVPAAQTPDRAASAGYGGEGKNEDTDF